MNTLSSHTIGLEFPGLGRGVFREHSLLVTPKWSGLLGSDTIPVGTAPVWPIAIAGLVGCEYKQ